MITLTEAEYRAKVYGSWLGCTIGAAVGQQGDGRRRTFEVGGYPELLSQRSPIPYEGTDIQLVWLRALQTSGPEVTTDDLTSAWLRHLAHGHGEYPYAQANFCRDIPPPVSGAFDNPFRESLGALARAALWGMVAPGDPEQAAWFARRDAMLDHVGAGMEAGIWLAGMVSAAFTDADLSQVLDVGLNLIPEDGKLARALQDVMRWHGEHANVNRTLEMLLRSYNSEDVRDSVVAAGQIELALLHGKADFERSLLTAAKCGWSSVCTCAAVGGILGVALGRDGLPETWRNAVRQEIVAGWGVVGLPRTIPCTKVADSTCEIGRLVIRSMCAGRVQIVKERAEEEQREMPTMETAGILRQLAIGPYVASYRRNHLRVQIDYDGRPTIGYDSPRRFTIALTNTGSRSLEVMTRVSAPAGFVVSAPPEPVALGEGTRVSFLVTCTAPRGHARIAVINPCTLFLSADDGSEVPVPITLVGEALWYAAGPYEDFEEAHTPEQSGILNGDTPLGEDGWRELSVSEPMTNLLASLDGEQGTYYLATDIFAPRTRQAKLRVGCNDGIKMWFNGKEICQHHEHRPVSPLSADEFEAELREGWNRLVLKMAQCTPRRFLSFALKDPQGQMLIEAVNTVPRS